VDKSAFYKKDLKINMHPLYSLSPSGERVRVRGNKRNTQYSIRDTNYAGRR